jgi:hypothetical protein
MFQSNYQELILYLIFISQIYYSKNNTYIYKFNIIKLNLLLILQIYLLLKVIFIHENY